MNNRLLSTAVLTTLALIAFAANSVLCRLALGHGMIDAAGFTSVRLLSGAAVLFTIMLITKGRDNKPKSTGSWYAAFMLFLYATAFSFAYIALDTATGALILFGVVQVTMVGVFVAAGNRLHKSEWCGIALAFAGFVYLIAPDLRTPSAMGFLLMSIAGITWAVYTIKGHGSTNPLMDTAYNFFRTIPFVLLLLVISMEDITLSNKGILLAALSGGVTSALGYTIWYTALAGLSSAQAAVLQLAVPVLAALGGLLFVSEPFTIHFAVSALMVLGGIAMVLWGKYYFRRR